LHDGVAAKKAISMTNSIFIVFMFSVMAKITEFYRLIEGSVQGTKSIAQSHY
jgi:hypothetical protein